MNTTRVLIVEDDEAAMYGYNRYFGNSGYQITSVRTLKDAKEVVAGEKFDAIILDLNLPDGDSTEWIPELKRLYPSMPVIVITGICDIPTAVKAIKDGAENFLTKPIEMSILKVVLEKCLEVGALRKRDLIQQRLVKKDSPYFGANPLTTQILEHATIAAASSNVILLLGETGTGKGLLARWIHDHSERASKPFVEVNCSSLKGELLRSELFGHVRGAFTSAIKDKEGLLEVADGGTLFLDEIGDMDIEVQAQLLKTIEEKSFRRIGDNSLRKSDFRLLCATNRDLIENESGRFRRDLYYRICVFPINLPGLRDKKDELPGLCEHMLNGLAYAYLPISEELMSMLRDYSWPGNARELRNMFERALMLAQGKPLTLNHFPGLTAESQTRLTTATSQKLEDVSDAHIQSVVDEFAGDMHKASEVLGLCVSSLYRRLGKIKGSPVS